jgi:hypothetical protein
MSLIPFGLSPQVPPVVLTAVIAMLGIVVGLAAMLYRL